MTCKSCGEPIEHPTRENRFEGMCDDCIFNEGVIDDARIEAERDRENGEIV